MRPKSEIEAEWNTSIPYALGALLDLASRVLAIWPEVRASAETSEFRMQDFSLIAACVDRVLGTRTLATYRDKIRTASQAALRENIIVAAIVDHVQAAGGTVEMTTKQVYDQFVAPHRHRLGADTPKNEMMLSKKLQRSIGVLRKNGVHAAQVRNSKMRGWRFVSTESPSVDR